MCGFGQPLTGGNAIWVKYNDFQAYLYDELVERNGHLLVDNVQVIEIINHMRTWIDSLDA
jgi:hypothetical protein